MTVLMAVAVLAALQIKHMFADFFWQTRWMLLNKGHWGHPGGLTHAGLHAGLSLLILLSFGVDAQRALLVALFEAAVHYHIDWAKARYSETRSYGLQDNRYWQALGLDQCAHQMTYLGMLVMASA